MPAPAEAELDDVFATGRSIVAAGSDVVASVAEVNDIPVARLTDQLSGDESLRVDPDGVLVVFDPVHGDHGDDVAVAEPTLDFASLDPDTLAAVIDALATPASAGASLPALVADQTFGLHSRIGATKVAYLDFTGHRIAGTAWNQALAGGADIEVPAWDIDGDPSRFGAAERSIILEIWRRVAEDFAPFDIDVTTAEPSAEDLVRSEPADTRFGTRLLVAPTSKLDDACICGGVSYVGVVDRVADSLRYQPGVVFSSRLGASNPKTLAEAASHEIGHAFGLGHVTDATGNGYFAGGGVWAPIMGESYGRPVTRWLTDAHVEGIQFREVEIFSRHGLLPAADDHGDIPSSATNLGNGPSISGAGLISTASDVDVFSFTTTGGRVILRAEPVAPGANLDIALRVTTPDGSVVATANPVASFLSAVDALGLDAEIDVELAAGTYDAEVSGAGVGVDDGAGFTDRGSMGRYTLVGSVPTTSNRSPVAVPTASAQSWEPGAPVRFDAGGSSDIDGAIVRYRWDFGDGAVSDLAQVSKSFPAAGSYAAVLTVIDDDAAVASAAVLITIGVDGGVIRTIDLDLSASSSSAAAREARPGAAVTAAAPLPAGSGRSDALAILPETH